MSYQITDVVIRARQIIQDLETPYRHSDQKLINYLNDALSDTRRLRPDLFIGSLATQPQVYTDADLLEDFPIDYTYFSTIVDYLASSVGIEDDEFAQDGRAITLHQRFVQKLMGKFG